MTDHSAAYNLLQLERRPNWYDHLSQVEAAMAEDDRVFRLRTAAGWTCDEGGWYSHDGTHESDWEDEGLPLPEDVELYSTWHSAYYHYDAVDEGIPQLDPYPNGLPTP